MKKIFSLLLALAVIFCSSTAVADEPVTGSDIYVPVAGDLDRDGYVSSADALIVLCSSVGKKLFKNVERPYADVDGIPGITSSDALEILKYSVRLTDKLTEGQPVYKKYFTMSFDDGITQDRRITEILRKYNLNATFNINTGLFGVTWNLRPLGVDADHIRVAESEVKEGLYDGFEVAVHTLTHLLLPGLSDEQVINEVKGDAENIARLTGKMPTGMAYPGGSRESYDERVENLITQNTTVRYARTGICNQTFGIPENFMEWDPSSWFIQDDLMNKAQEFADAEPTNGDLLFYVWGHGYEFDAYNAWERFDEFCAFMSGLCDVESVTNGEVYYIFSDFDAK